ncbi:hypothetical protein WUBG_14164, partial [Wuchereria bancrofti]
EDLQYYHKIISYHHYIQIHHYDEHSNTFDRNHRYHHDWLLNRKQDLVQKLLIAMKSFMATIFQN